MAGPRWEGMLDLSLSEEQRLLEDVARRFFKEHYSAEQRNDIIVREGGWSDKVWKKFAELGWLGLRVPPEYGGQGLGMVEAGLVAGTLGEALVVEPLLISAVLASVLIDRLATPEQKSRYLPALTSGEQRFAVAICEPQCAHDLDQLATCAIRSDRGWQLSGCKSLVFGACKADLFLVISRLGSRADRSFGVFAVPALMSPEKTPYRTADRQQAAHLVFRDVRLPDDALLGSDQDNRAAIELALDATLVTMAWEAVGCMDALLAATIDYVSVRKQFGRTLSSNQVIRHRLAQMKVQIELARAAALHAALVIDRSDSIEAARAASGAKVKAGEAGRFVAEQAVQLHGGMGVTEELMIGSYFKRLMTLRLLFGSPDFHLERHVGLTARLKAGERPFP